MARVVTPTTSVVVHTRDLDVVAGLLQVTRDSCPDEREGQLTCLGERSMSMPDETEATQPLVGLGRVDESGNLRR